MQTEALRRKSRVDGRGASLRKSERIRRLLAWLIAVLTLGYIVLAAWYWVTNKSHDDLLANLAITTASAPTERIDIAGLTQQKTEATAYLALVEQSQLPSISDTGIGTKIREIALSSRVNLLGFEASDPTFDTVANHKYIQNRFIATVTGTLDNLVKFEQVLETGVAKGFRVEQVDYLTSGSPVAVNETLKLTLVYESLSQELISTPKATPVRAAP